MEESKETKINKKILILGLDNAGKSSIILSLQHNTNLLSALKLKPTKGVNIVEGVDGDTKFYIWDYGGQKTYREAHLKDLKKGLTKAEKVIYVVDVQAPTRFDLSRGYFESILRGIEEINSSLHLSVFLHKCDPSYKDIDEEMLSDMVKKMVEKIPENIEFEIFRTSIFTVFQKLIYDYKKN